MLSCFSSHQGSPPNIIFTTLSDMRTRHLQLLILAAVSTIMASAESPPLRCPRLCQCSIDGQDALCSDIRLDHFPVDIPETIKSLDVSSNSISNVSYEDLKRFRQLKYLDISSNNIQNLWSETLSAVTLLEGLDLSFNKITRFHPRTFSQNRILTHLSIRGNPLQTAGGSPVLTSDSLRSLELDLGAWSEHTFKKLKSLDRLTVHWKKGISLSSTPFEALYRLRELNIICAEECDEETVSLPTYLTTYFNKQRVKVVFNRTTGRQVVVTQETDSNEESEVNQGITEASSSPRQGADEQNGTPLISGPVAAIIPVTTHFVQEKVSDHKDSTLTSSTQEATDKIEIDEEVKNKFLDSDSSSTTKSFGREVHKKQAPEVNENKIHVHENVTLMFATNGVIIMLLILILTLVLCIAACRYRQTRGRFSPVKQIPGNLHFLEKAPPQYEHVYDEPKEVDRRLLYHIYYDHNAPLLPHRPHQSQRPQVPPRPVGYYAVAYESERK